MNGLRWVCAGILAAAYVAAGVAQFRYLSNDPAPYTIKQRMRAAAFWPALMVPAARRDTSAGHEARRWTAEKQIERIIGAPYPPPFTPQD